MTPEGQRGLGAFGEGRDLQFLRRAASVLADSSVMKSLSGSPRHSAMAASYASKRPLRTLGRPSSSAAETLAARASRMRWAKSMTSTVGGSMLAR